MSTAHSLVIEYCVPCSYLSRALWQADELLRMTHDSASLTLVPATGGRYRITLDDAVIWDKEAEGGFPEIDQLFERVNATV
jgi:selenoprotein W-related protein